MKRSVILLLLLCSCSNHNKTVEKWDDGAPKETRNYEHGRDSAKYERTLFYETGKVKETGVLSVYDDDTLKYGEWKHFDKNGHLKKVENYVNGIKSGEFKEYHVNGLVKLTYSYNYKGLLEGDWKEFYSDGAPKIEGSYVYGTKTSTWIFRNPQGQTIKIETLDQNGRLLDEVEHLENGKTIVTEYADNVLKSRKVDSFWTYYYANGSVMKEEIMVNDTCRLLNYWDAKGNQLVKKGEVIDRRDGNPFYEDRQYIEIEYFTDDL